MISSIRHKTTVKKIIKKAVIVIGVSVFWLLIWELISIKVQTELLLPSPLKVASTWVTLIQTKTFWISTGFSLLRITIGYILAVVVGCFLAFLTAHFAILRAVLSPILRIIKAAPVASFIILALVWIQTDFLPLFIAFLMVIPLVWANVEQGILQTDKKLLEMGKVFGLSKAKLWKTIRLPSVMPYLISAMQTGLGFAWKSGIAAEVICRPNHAIGDSLYHAKQVLETPEVFAWTATVIVLSVCLEKLLLWGSDTFGRRYNAENGGKQNEY